MNNGKQGENLFKQIMESRNYKVEDVSGNEEYWNKDIDFIITSSTTGITKTFECKFDSRINQTNNLYLERTNIHSKNGIGWFEFCQADYLAYGDAITGTFYIIPMADLRERAKSLPYRSAKCGYDSTGQLVSLKDIEDIVEVL